jgi:hypothetical protein
MSESSIPDFTRFARKPSERVAIVEYIHATPNLQETDYLEWKTGYDLSKRPGAAATARQLIGMANRDTAHAIRHTDGHAYVLLGVEPGNLPGVPEWDSSDIEKWLTPFVGPDLRYDAHYVRIEGHPGHVLFLTIDPPREGDPIYNLLKSSQDPVTSKSLDAGTIYVRHGSNTAPAKPDDLKRLAARAAVAERPTLDVEVLLDTSKATTINKAIASDEYRDQNLRSWKAKMLGKLPRREPERAKGPLDLIGMPSFDLDYSIQLPPLGEKRSEEQYKAEVEQHVQAMRVSGVWLQTVAVDWVKRRGSPLGVSVKNNTDQNYENAVIELFLFGVTRGNVFAAEGDAARLLRVPEEPEEWGSRSDLSHVIARKYAATPIVTAMSKPRPEVEEPGTGQVLVRYPELRIRPHTKHKLEPLLLALAPFMADTTVPVHWRVTASNTSGHQEGDIEFHVPGGSQEADKPDVSRTE